MSLSSKCGRSARNKLKRRGLSKHPCLTPRFTSMVSVILSSCLIHTLSLVYMFLITLKNFPSIPKSKSFFNRMSRGIVSNALLKSMKQA